MDDLDENILTTLKILIIGESFVGKSRFEFNYILIDLTFESIFSWFIHFVNFNILVIIKVIQWSFIISLIQLLIDLTFELKNDLLTKNLTQFLTQIIDK